MDLAGASIKTLIWGTLLFCSLRFSVANGYPGYISPAAAFVLLVYSIYLAVSFLRTVAGAWKKAGEQPEPDGQEQRAQTMC
jgi:hypothetical protein